MLEKRRSSILLLFILKGLRMFILPELNKILLFISAATLLIVIPGPAVLYILTKSIEQGYKAGIVSVLGVAAGGLVHVLAAGIGVSALFVASATAFSALKYVGALYLMYLGIKKIRSREAFNQTRKGDRKKKLPRIFSEAMLVNIFNPKTAIFFVAFLPQFTNVEKGGITFQIFFLGFIFIALAIISDCIYVLIAGRLFEWVSTNQSYQKMQKRFSGAIYIMLGILTLSVNQPDHHFINRN